MLVFCLLSLVWKQLALIVSDIEKDQQTRTRELKRAVNKNSFQNLRCRKSRQKALTPTVTFHFCYLPCSETC